MRVVDQDDDRPLRRECFQQLAHAPERLLGGSRALAEPDCRGDTLENEPLIRVRPQQARDLCAGGID